MSSFSGPGVVSEGLVFAYDIGNSQKSWRGAPTTNLHPLGGYISWPAQTLHFWNGNNWVVDSTYTDPGVPGPAGTYLGQVRKYTSGALSASWSGNSYAYILKTAPMTAGVSYAMSAYTFLSGDCNIDAMYSSIEGASVAALSGGYVTAYDMAQKGSWQRQGLQGTASGNVNFIIAYPQRYGITNGSFTGSILVGGAQVEVGTFPTPYTDTSRSNTQALLDLTNNNTINTNSLTYSSNNTFSFNSANSNNIAGTVNSAYHPSTNSIDRSWEVFVKPTATQTTAGLFGHVVSAGCTYYCNGGVCIWGGNYAFNWFDNSAYQFLDSGIAATSGQWAHVVGTYSSSDGKTRIYVNGILRNTFGSSTNLNYGAYAYEYQTGYLSASGNYFTGDMSVVKYYYNKSLSAAQVQQNFQALRTRYSI